jgi:hypothetical protein
MPYRAILDRVVIACPEVVASEWQEIQQFAFLRNTDLSQATSVVRLPVMWETTVHRLTPAISAKPRPAVLG